VCCEPDFLDEGTEKKAAGIFTSPLRRRRHRHPTRAFEDAVQKFDFKYILSLDDIVASRGGIPLIEDGKVIGAVGCSGGTGSQDEAICTTAATLVNKYRHQAHPCASRFGFLATGPTEPHID
jgi:uncharacterized protein GlcG (DUF336 family)